MAGELKNVGATPAGASDLATRKYISDLKADDTSAEEIDGLINEALEPYASKSYVTARDALNASKAYVDDGDATRLHLADRNADNGVAGLDASGRIERSRIPVSSTQRLLRGPWVPSSYGTAPVTASTTTEQQLMPPIPITDPGHPYRLMVFGNLTGLTLNDGVAPIIRVRVGSMSGPIIAEGVGSTEGYDYLGIDTFDRVTIGNAGGTTQWNEYVREGTAGFAECDGSKLTWKPSGVLPRMIAYQRVGDDAITPTNYQTIRMHMASVPEYPTTANPGQNRIMGRANEAFNQYVGFLLTDRRAWFGYSTGGTETLLKVEDIDFDPTDIWTAKFGTETAERHFQLFRNDETTPVVDFLDEDNVTLLGANNRGWGFGLRAGSEAAFALPFRQAPPGDIDKITINDSIPGQDQSSYAPVPIIPVSMATQSSRTGAASLYVTVASSTALRPVRAGHALNPNLSIMALAA